MSIGSRIQQLRKQRKMSQEELGERLEVTRQTVSKWELDQSTPDLDYISAISDLFEVTTDYLIKGEKNSEPSAYYPASAAPVSRKGENVSEGAEIRYFENGIGQPVISMDTASAASEKYVVTLKINFKAIFKTLLAIAAMFLSFFGCITAIGFMVQPYVRIFVILGSSFLFVVGAFVFVAGMSAFAEPLMRFSKFLNKLFSYICGFGKNFTRAFKTVEEKRTYFSEENGEHAAGKKNLFSNKMIGLLLAIAGCYFSIFSIFVLFHFFNGYQQRNSFLLIMEIILLLASVAAIFVGVKMFLRFSESSKVMMEEKDDTADITDIKCEKAVQKNTEKALRIREGAEIKAALIMEKYRLRAEKIAPKNSVKAEKIIEKSKLYEAQILKRAEKKAEIVLNGRFNRGGSQKNKAE